MHECVGASQGYHGVVGGLGLGLGLGLVLGGGVSMAICPTGVGIPLYPWQHLDRTSSAEGTRCANRERGRESLTWLGFVP